MAKSFKDSFNSLASRIPKSSGKTCAQCTNQDCGKCKYNMNSYNHIFGNQDQNPNPRPNCFHYIIIQDTSCSNFGSSFCDWTIDDGIHGSDIFQNDWSIYMANNFQLGGGGLYPDIFCSGLPTTYVLRSFSPIAPTNTITIQNQNCNLIQQSFQTLCDKSCWELSIFYNNVKDLMNNIGITEFGNIYLSNMDPANDPIGFNSMFQYYIQQIYGNGASTSTIYDIATSTLSIKIFNIYTNFNPVFNFFSSGSPYFYTFTNINCP